MERMYRIAGIFIAMFMLFSIDTKAEEFLVYDAIKTNKLSSPDSGFIFFDYRGTAPDNWESPVDYSNGSFEIRYEIIDVPTDIAFNLNVCIWQYIGTETGKWDSLETCTQQQLFPGGSTIIEQSTPVSQWYKKDGLPLNWSDPAGFNSMGVALYNAAGCVVTGFDVSPATSCWEDAPNYLNMKLRIIIVAVSNGGTFSGWNNYVTPNNPPKITSPPITDATEDVLYEYQVTATDADVNDVLTYSLTDQPSWLSIDSSTGMISGTPTNNNVGDTTVVVEVTDNKEKDTQTYTLSVANVNDDPVITSTPPTDAKEGMQYDYQVTATDSDGDVLTYSLSVKPSWLNIDGSSGLVSGTPMFEDGGDNNVEVSVDDGNGGKATQAYIIAVETVTITGISDLDGINRLSLEQNYPNPFNYTTSIPFSLEEESQVKISIYNLSGKEITTLFSGRRSAGNHSVKFNATNLPNGIYFYSLDIGDHNEIKKMILKK